MSKLLALLTSRISHLQVRRQNLGRMDLQGKHVFVQQQLNTFKNKYRSQRGGVPFFLMHKVRYVPGYTSHQLTSITQNQIPLQFTPGKKYEELFL